jgi:hypothetical protein
VQRPPWILAFGLALLGAPAAAVPCGDDSCQEQEDRGDSSIQLKPPQPRDRSHDASRTLGDELTPGLRKKDERPSGLRDDGRAREWRKRIATLPVIPTQEPGNASMPIPESTDLILFGSGLLLAQTALRRRRS